MQVLRRLTVSWIAMYIYTNGTLYSTEKKRLNGQHDKAGNRNERCNDILCGRAINLLQLKIGDNNLGKRDN